MCNRCSPRDLPRCSDTCFAQRTLESGAAATPLTGGIAGNADPGQLLRPGDDVLLPKGGMRQWFYDINPESPAYGFPVLIIATEPDGKEVEYYLFEKLKFGVPFKDSDFSPERLDKKG